MSIHAALRQHCPDGIDVYFDNVGGEILDAVLRRLKLKARIVLCGGISQYNATGETRGPANYLSLISARARMEGFVVIDYLHRAEEAIAAMTPWVAAGKLGSKLDIVEGLREFSGSPAPPVHRRQLRQAAGQGLKSVGAASAAMPFAKSIAAEAAPTGMTFMDFDVVVIGGGAAGLMCALTAGQRGTARAGGRTRATAAARRS